MAGEEKQGPRYPFISLRKALDRARAVWNAAQTNNVIYSDLVNLWKYKASSSGGTQTVAALRYYGLINVGGVKDTRKFRLSEEARKYFLDERPEKHAEAHKSFALHPRAMQLLWELWTDKPPTEIIARSTLKIDYGYSENNARELIAIYADNLEFANLCNSDRITFMGDETNADVVSEPLVAQDARTTPTTTAQPVAPSMADVNTPVPEGIRRDAFNMPEGVVTLSFPEAFSKDSYEDLQAWLDFQKNRLKRWISE